MLKFLLIILSIYIVLGFVTGIVFSYGVSLYEDKGLKTSRLTLWLVTMFNILLWPGTVWYVVKEWKTFVSPDVNEMQEKFDYIDDMINGEGS